MRRLLSLGTALGFSVALLGCSGNTHENALPKQSGQSDQGPAWSLKLQTACFAAAGDQCVGRYGLSVSADGQYLVGPANGQERRGVLSDAQMATLNARLQPIVTAPLLTANTVENHESGIENESDDTLTLTRQSQSVVLAHNTGAEFYFRTPNASEVVLLHKAMRDLADIYYELPFGNDCSAAAAAVESLYSTTQNCQVDNDCVYVNAYRGYEIVPPRSVQYLFTDRCEVVHPLLVANRLAILSAANGLLDAIETAKHRCDQFMRQNCGFPQQRPTSVAPTCVQNHCQSHL